MNDKTMEPRQKENTKAAIVIQVIRSPPSSPLPPKPPDMGLYAVVKGFVADPSWVDNKETHSIRVRDLALEDEK